MLEASEGGVGLCMQPYCFVGCSFFLHKAKMLTARAAPLLKASIIAAINGEIILMLHYTEQLYQQW